MNTSLDVPQSVAHAQDSPDLRPLRRLATVAVPAGLILLGIPVLTGTDTSPFVLATLLFGLVIPAVVLTRRDPHGSVKQLLRDCVRISPRALLLMVPALALLPALTWGGGQLAGHGVSLTTALVVASLIDVGSSLAIVNLWEEMVWQGFVQRRASARWGFVGGSLVTTALFVGVHLPLAFAEVDGRRNIVLGLSALVVAGVGLRFLTGAADVWSGRSILVVAVLHASFNVAADFVDPSADWVRYAVTIGLGLLVVLTSPVARRFPARR
jgi:membrane protease YdiL (CAAX protease family)